MQLNRAIILTEEELDRLIEILDHSGHDDSGYLKTKIYRQQHHNPADQDSV